MTESAAHDLFPAPEPVRLPIVGRAETFPVRRVFCVGQNYAAHAREMGSDPDRTPPFFFCKPADAVVPGGGEVAYPSQTADLHHEVELVIALGDGGRDIPVETAGDFIFGWAVGVDLTRRDLQAAAKKGGKPWDAAKGFDQSAPVSAIIPRDPETPLAGRLRLSVDGQVRQDGELADMIWNPAEIVAAASRLWALRAGDLIFTGTPEGVGPIARGQGVEAEIDGVGRLSFKVL